MNTENDKKSLNNINPDYDDNQNSIVELVTHYPSSKKVLLTGDMQKDDEYRFICNQYASSGGECRSSTEKNLIKNVDILKLGHHGAYTSSIPEFLDWVNPTNAIITNGKWNNINDLSYNFGSLKHLAQKNKNIYLTAYNDVDGHDMTDSSDEKKALIVNFTSSGYSIINGNGASVSKFDVVGDKNTFTKNWVKMKYFNQTGWIYFDDTKSDYAKKAIASATTNGKKYCYHFHYKSGIMLKGWTQRGGKMFYFTEGYGKSYTFDNSTDCSLNTGYLKLNNEWLNTKDNNWYYLVNNEVVTGWKEINGNWYYFDGDTSEKNDPYAYGLMATGWRTINSKKYYFATSGNKTGRMMTGWFTVGSGKYYADSQGSIQTGLVKISGKTYYFDTSSWALVTGFRNVNGKIYYFNQKNNSGELLTGRLIINNEVFYTDSSGAIKTGWYKDGNDIYYLRPSASGNSPVGSAIHDVIIKVGEKSFTFGSNGACTTCKGLVTKPTASYCNSVAYSGSAQTITKTPGTGYTFSGNQQTNVGTYAVTASLTDGYMWDGYTTDNASFNCSIVPTSIESASVTLSDQTYTGSAITPLPEVKYGTRTLVKNTDYTITYVNNINVGTATMIITGKGNFNRTKTVTFKIIDGGVEIINPTNMKLIDNKICINLAGARSINKITMFNNIRNNSNKKCYNKSNVEVTADTAVINTGFRIATDTASYPIVIYGDIDGTGTINANDMGIVYRYISSTSSITFDDIAKTAADLDRSGTVNANDLRNIYTIIKRQNQ